MIFFLYGPDTFRARQKLNELKEKFVKEVDESSLNLTYLSGKNLDIAQFNQAVATPPFLARKRMVIIDNLLSNEPDQELTKQILEILGKEDLIKDILLIFLETDDFKRDGVLSKRLIKEKYAQEFELLKDSELRNWLRVEFRNRGGKISSTALERLAGLVGNDLWQLNSEIDKLIAYAGDNSIEEKDVTELVRGRFDDNIFHLIDAIAAKNSRLAHQLLSEQFDSGADELYILTMLTRQFRILLQTRELAEANRQITKTQVASQLGVHPFVAQKALGQIKNFSAAKLKDIYRQLLDADVRIKTNYATVPVIFDLLLSKIIN
ncbi:MAG: DNA polymerase III subunit delta [Patescibacteria group bacterium]